MVWNLNFMTFHSVGNFMEFHHPNWRRPSFFRGVVVYHQPEIDNSTKLDGWVLCMYYFVSSASIFFFEGYEFVGYRSFAMNLQRYRKSCLPFVNPKTEAMRFDIFWHEWRMNWWTVVFIRKHLETIKMESSRMNWWYTNWSLIVAELMCKICCS